MTWNPLKKSYLTTKPSLVTQVIPKQQDRELENIFVKLQILEETNRRIQKEIKRYIEGSVNLSKAELRLTADLSSSSLCHQDAAMRALIEEYLTVTSQVGDSVQEVTKICQKAISEPLKRFGGEFSGIAALIMKREQAFQELLRQQARQRKADEKEKTASNVLKREQAQKAVGQAKEEVSAVHERLLVELPQFYDLRSEFFTPCLQALIRAQMDYHGTTLRLFTHLSSLSCVPGLQAVPQPRSALPESQFQARLQSRLSALQALNIVRHPSCPAPS